MKVAPHTALKHRMLGMYFKICREVAKDRKLYYVDLYTGDGEAECDESPIKKWKCPFIKGLLEHAKKGEIKLNCFLNELDPKKEGYFDKLVENVKEFRNSINSLTKEDANSVYKKILSQIPATEWSLFFLDPFKHNDLKWQTIEGISKHEGFDKVSNCKRKPELIINLMTVTMQRTTESNPDAITEALGTDEWKERIRGQTEELMHEIFLEIFTKQLEKLGYSVSSICVKQTPPNGNVLYYLLFASAIPGANQIIAKKYKPYIESIMRDKWVKENFKYRLITKEEKSGATFLTQFQQKN